jgi:hypothetical protein
MSTVLTIPDGCTVTVSIDAQRAPEVLYRGEPVNRPRQEAPYYGNPDRSGSMQDDQRRALFALARKVNGGLELTDEQRRALTDKWVGVGSWADLSRNQASTILAGLFALDHAGVTL